MAVGSGKVERVDRLVHVALKNNRGIHGLLDLYDRAACDVYHPRSYTEEDYLRSLLFWRLGGRRLADIAHLSMNMPALRTVRRHTIIPRLIASPGQPTVHEFLANTTACMKPITEIISVGAQSESAGVAMHQVLMFDEIKVEERPRWDDRTNYIQGVCREHGRPASLLYTSNLEVDHIFEQIADGSVHLASNVSVINHIFTSNTYDQNF